MAEKAPGGQPIIKKIKKIAAGHHGGSWKVALADLMTTLMAFFLVMWLIELSKPDDRDVRVLKQGIANYFNFYTIFPRVGKKKVHVTKRLNRNSVLTPEELVNIIIDTYIANAPELREHINVTRVREGVKVDIMDSDTKNFFSPTDLAVKPPVRRAIELLCTVLRKLENPLTLEGHVQATPEGSPPYDEWLFSTTIATASLPVFTENSVQSDRFTKITGFAAKQGMLGYQNWDSANRRLSVVVIFPVKYIEVTGDGTDQIGDLGGITPDKNKGGEVNKEGGEKAEPAGEMPAEPAADQHGN